MYTKKKLKDLEACTPKSVGNVKRKIEDNQKEILEDSNILKKRKPEDNIDRQKTSPIVEARKSLAKFKFKFSKSNLTLENAPLAAESENFQGFKVLKLLSIVEKIKCKEVLERASQAEKPSLASTANLQRV